MTSWQLSLDITVKVNKSDHGQGDQSPICSHQTNIVGRATDISLPLLGLISMVMVDVCIRNKAEAVVCDSSMFLSDDWGGEHWLPLPSEYCHSFCTFG